MAIAHRHTTDNGQPPGSVPPSTEPGEKGQERPEGIIRVPGLVAAARGPSGRDWRGGRAGHPSGCCCFRRRWRGRGQVRRRSSPGLGGWSFLSVSAFPWLARLVTMAALAWWPQIWAVHSMTSLRPYAFSVYLVKGTLWGANLEKLGVTAVPLCGLGLQSGGPLDHQVSAWVGCLPFGVARPPGTPRCASRPRGGTSPTVLARRATPGTPRMRFAPARWYLADTPAAHRAQGPGSLGRSRAPRRDPLRCSPIAPAAHPSLRPGFVRPVTARGPDQVHSVSFTNQ